MVQPIPYDPEYAAKFEGIYLRSLHPDVRAMDELPHTVADFPMRMQRAIELSAQGHTVDIDIMVFRWGAYNVNLKRLWEGRDGVGANGQAIKASINEADYPAWKDPNEPPPPPPDTSIVGSYMGFMNRYFSGPSGIRFKDGEKDPTGKFTKRVVRGLMGDAHWWEAE